MNADLDLDLHINQLKVFKSPSRLKAILAGRGWGKSLYLLTDAIVFCAGYEGKINPRSPQVAALVMPTLVQAKAIHWHPLLNILENSPLVENINRSELRVVFKGKNKPDLLLKGADRQGDRLRGLNLVYCGLDEMQDMHPQVFPEVVFPALGRNKDWQCRAIGTPKGKASYFFQFCKMAYQSRGMRYFHFKSEDNPFFPKENLKKAKLILPARTYRQEHEASWEELEGAIFPSFSSTNIVSGVFGDIYATYLGVDWGDVHPALVVVALTGQGKFFVVDKWENPHAESNTPVTEDELLNEACRLARKWKIFRAFAPDDRPASIMSMRRRGSSQNILGLQKTVGVPRHDPGVMQRYQIADSLFYQQRLFIVDQFKDLKINVQSFHRAKSKEGFLMNEPASGQNDHAIDAGLAYCAAHLEYLYGENLLSSAA